MLPADAVKHCLEVRREIGYLIVMARPAKPAPNPSDEIFTVSTLAHYLHCHPTTVYRLLKEKKIPAFKLGSDWRFWRSAIDKWITGLHNADLPVTRGNVRRRRL